MKLSDGEKLILLMLSDISKKLGAGRELDPEFVSHTIFNGRTWGFNWKFHGNLPIEDRSQPPEVDETVDILEMFSLMIDHFRVLSEEDQQKVKDRIGYSAHGLEQFAGFDGNHDDHYGVAQYLVEHLDRFKHLPGATNNSHTQSSLPTYRRMYRTYEPMRSALGSGRLTAEQFIEIFGADDS